MSQKDVIFLAVILALAGGWGYSHYQRSLETARPAVHGAAAVSGGPICGEHHIPEAKCGFCHPELTETLGFCKGHGVPEVFCYQCDPDLIPAFQAAGDWCKEHARPESQCALCKAGAQPHSAEGAEGAHGTEIPAPLPLQDVVVRRAAAGAELPRHRLPPAPGCSTHDLRVRFRTAAIEEQAGLELVTVDRGPLAETVVANATLSFDRNRHARLTPRAPGIVRSVEVDVGDRVEAGQVLANVDSQELGSAKAALLQAHAGVSLWQKNRDREEDLRLQGIAAERNLLEAETRLTEARISRTGAEQRLRNLGLSSSDVERVVHERETSSLLPLVAPFGGEVVGRHAVLGEAVDTSQPMIEVTDPKTLWAMIDLYEEDLRKVELGQRVLLDFDGLPGRVFTGPIAWISRSLDPRTRTLRARVEVDNPDGLLRAEMFGRARVELSREDAVRVSKQAVQWDGTCNTVFVRQDAGVYEPRRVWLGFESGGAYEVRDGLEAGEVVVTTGSFLLKTEVMKGSIGAGCCEVERPRS